MLRVGLTGGIASGKSTVADLFADLGAVVIDTDVIARQVVEPGSGALGEIRRHFGAGVIGGDGTLDRRALRAIVFADDSQRLALEGILHPRIRSETQRQAEAASGPYQIIVVPLLVGSPMQDMLQRILVVDCDQAVQLERLLARDVQNEAQARRMIAAQASNEERLAIADDVIDNSASLDATRQQIIALHKSYLALANEQN